MKCPKCLAAMEEIDYNGVEIDRCTKCYGLFFDHLEQESLRQMEGSEGIDIGDEFVGAKYNQIMDVPCPKCETRMQEVVHSDPFEIKFERCPQCKGMFFDAGEFRDYLEDEIYDQFMQVIGQLD